MPSKSNIVGDGPGTVWLIVGLDAESGGPDMDGIDGNVAFVGVPVVCLLAREARADEVNRTEERTEDDDCGEEGVPATASCITC